MPAMANASRRAIASGAGFSGTSQIAGSAGAPESQEQRGQFRCPAFDLDPSAASFAADSNALSDASLAPASTMRERAWTRPGLRFLPCSRWRAVQAPADLQTRVQSGSAPGCAKHRPPASTWKEHVPPHRSMINFPGSIPGSIPRSIHGSVRPARGIRPVAAGPVANNCGRKTISPTASPRRANAARNSMQPCAAARPPERHRSLPAVRACTSHSISLRANGTRPASSLSARLCPCSHRGPGRRRRASYAATTAGSTSATSVRGDAPSQHQRPDGRCDRLGVQSGGRIGLRTGGPFTRRKLNHIGRVRWTTRGAAPHSVKHAQHGSFRTDYEEVRLSDAMGTSSCGRVGPPGRAKGQPMRRGRLGPFGACCERANRQHQKHSAPSIARRSRPRRRSAGPRPRSA